MSTTTRLMKASVDQVWEVLCDGWLFPLWVVGSSRMREVDDTWPAVGSRLHHSVGTWPLLLDDNTEVLACDPRSQLKLRARAWPAGEAEVVVHLRPRGADTEIVIEEQAVSGPGGLTPKLLQDPLLNWRNVETLRRLAFVVENRP